MGRVTYLVRVESKTFVAGMVYNGRSDKIISAAPIIRWMVGLSGDDAREEIKRRGWKATVAKPFEMLNGDEQRRGT